MGPTQLSETAASPLVVGGPTRLGSCDPTAAGGHGVMMKVREVEVGAMTTHTGASNRATIAGTQVGRAFVGLVGLVAFIALLTSIG